MQSLGLKIKEYDMDRIANKKIELAKPDVLRLAQLLSSKASAPSAVDHKLIIKQCNSGNKIGRSNTRLEFDFQTFPEPLAIKRASTPGRTHNVIYRDY